MNYETLKTACMSLCVPWPALGPPWGRCQTRSPVRGGQGGPPPHQWGLEKRGEYQRVVDQDEQSPDDYERVKICTHMARNDAHYIMQVVTWSCLCHLVYRWTWRVFQYFPPERKKGEEKRSTVKQEMIRDMGSLVLQNWLYQLSPFPSSVSWPVLLAIWEVVQQLAPIALC